MISLAQTGIFLGFALSTPQGYLTAGKQATLLAFVRMNASAPTGRQLTLVMEGCKSTDQMDLTALAEIRRLSAEFMTRPQVLAPPARLELTTI